MAGACWREDVVYRAGFAVGERLRRELQRKASRRTAVKGLEAKVLIERWRQYTNTIWPHSALGYRPPAPPGVAGLLEGKTLT